MNVSEFYKEDIMSDIGNLIRDLRIDQRLTLKDVSEKTGLSISFLSQVERSKSSVTLQSLSRIADALGVSRSYFFTKKPDNRSIRKQKGENELDFRNTDFIYNGLTGDMENPIFEPMLVILLPGESDKTVSAHSGEEFVYVLSGTLTVQLDEQIEQLEEGDSFHIKSTVPHTWYNETSNVVKLIYVYSSFNT